MVHQYRPDCFSDYRRSQHKQGWNKSEICAKWFTTKMQANSLGCSIKQAPCLCNKDAQNQYATLTGMRTYSCLSSKLYASPTSYTVVQDFLTRNPRILRMTQLLWLIAEFSCPYMQKYIHRDMTFMCLVRSHVNIHALTSTVVPLLCGSIEKNRVPGKSQA